MTRLTPLFLLILVLAAGCNVYEGLYEEGESEDPEVLLEDAEIAMEQNRPDDAVTHLKKAIQNTKPGTLTQKRVKVSLAAAVLKTQQIDVLSFTQMVEQFVPASTRSTTASKVQSEACTFADGHTTEAFDPASNDSFKRLGDTASAEALQESKTLIAEALAGDTAVLPCDEAGIDEAIARLQSEGMPKDEIASALVSYSIVVSSLAYVDVVEAGGGDGQFFYVSPPNGSSYIGLCFPDAGVCMNTKNRVSSNLGSIDCATRLLQKRAALMGSTTATDMANLARDGYISLSSGLGDTQCISR